MLFRDRDPLFAYRLRASDIIRLVQVSETHLTTVASKKRTPHRPADPEPLR